MFFLITKSIIGGTNKAAVTVSLPITSQVFTAAVAMDDYCIAIYTDCTDKTTLGAITGVVTLPDAGSSAGHRHSLPLSPSPSITLTCVPEQHNYEILAACPMPDPESAPLFEKFIWFPLYIVAA